MTTIKDMFLQAPESQLSNAAVDSIRTWSEPPKALEILRTLDECARYEQASDVAMLLLDALLVKQLADEKLSRTELEAQAFWRERVQG